jgi:geranylgeranyl diphosphate synthase type I
MVNDNLGIMAREKLASLARRVDERLLKYWDEEIEKGFGFNKTQKELVKKMLRHAQEHNLRSAKRVRASFVIYGYLLGKELKNSRNQELKTEMEKVWRVAEGVEMVHTALLIHDDFMDQDKVRRGLPTTHDFFGKKDSHYGDSMAINIGDAVLCMGYERILMSGFDGEVTKKIMQQMLRGITNTAFGQAYDVSLGKILSVTDPTSPDGLRGAEEKVMSLHRAKTAIYTYENPLIIGGILGGLSEEALTILRDYAMEGGMAFQLQDDILGVYGDEEKTGKSSNSDLLQGKVTLLIVKVMEKGTEEQKRAIMRVWGKRVANENDIQIAKEAIKESGAYQYSVEVSRRLAGKAAETAAKLRTLELNSEAIDFLEGIERYMVEREV